MLTVDFSRIPMPDNSDTPFRVLDIGCGEGRHTSHCLRYPNSMVIAGDICHKDLVHTRNKLRFHEAFEECRGTWEMAVMDVTRLPFADSTFDLVICSEVLEHIPDHEKAVQELVRVLKPGSHLVVTVPRFSPEWLCWALSREYRNTPGGHIRIYSKNRLKNMIQKQGVRFLGSHHAHSIHTPYWWLKCLVGVNNEDSGLVRLYHRFLVWDIMEHPGFTRFLDRLMNPVMGKSLVLYFRL